MLPLTIKEVQMKNVMLEIYLQPAKKTVFRREILDRSRQHPLFSPELSACTNVAQGMHERGIASQLSSTEEVHT